jgi:hypothetical protein
MPQIDPARKKRLEESFVKHAALAQLYRWCGHHELGGSDHADPSDLLSEDAVVKLADGTVCRARDYWAAALEFPSACRNAHVLKSHHLDVMSDGRITLTATLDRYHVSSLSSAGVRNTPTRCKAVMTPLAGTLPRFAKIEISKEATQETKRFEYSPARNRLLSLVHYFTSLVENPARDSVPFREVLTDDFALHYVEPPVSTHAMLDAWVTGRLASVIASNHVIHDVAFEPVGQDDYAVTIVMESEALFPDGSGIISKNSQNWLVTDNAAERFARIKHVRIDRDAVHRFDVPDAGPEQCTSSREAPGMSGQEESTQ